MFVMLMEGNMREAEGEAKLYMEEPPQRPGTRKEGSGLGIVSWPLMSKRKTKIKKKAGL
jgi:hypothetical protein